MALAFGFIDRQAQARIRIGTAAALSRCNRDFARQLAKQLAALHIRFAFVQANVLPFTMSRHEFEYSLLLE
jgi:hypothetical protein